MSSVSESIVREYFELHEFLVRQHRKHIGQTRGEPDDGRGSSGEPPRRNGMDEQGSESGGNTDPPS